MIIYFCLLLFLKLCFLKWLLLTLVILLTLKKSKILVVILLALNKLKLLMVILLTLNNNYRLMNIFDYYLIITSSKFVFFPLIHIYYKEKSKKIFIMILGIHRVIMFLLLLTYHLMNIEASKITS